jgi:hypothetical protein
MNFVLKGIGHCRKIEKRQTLEPAAFVHGLYLSRPASGIV